MKKLITAVAIIAGTLVTPALYAYTLTVHNNSDYTVGLYNGATGYDNTVTPHATKEFNLSDGDNFQVYYNAPWGSGYIKDYLGGVSRDGNAGYMSLTLQQPGQPVNWYESNVTVGNTNFGSSELKHWPDAASIPGCNNQSWGTTCSAAGDSGSITLSN